MSQRAEEARAGLTNLKNVTKYISMAMDLHPTLGDILDDFLYCEMACVFHQAAELEVVLKLHQALMKEVCHSIKAHDHWVRYGSYFPFSTHCNLCCEAISPEFDRGRHRGCCALKRRTA